MSLLELIEQILNHRNQNDNLGFLYKNIKLKI